MKPKKQATAPATTRRFIPAGARIASLEPAPPPLPDPVPDTREAGPYPQQADLDPLQPTVPAELVQLLRRLRSGCYLLRYTPTQTFPLVHYDGTMRVERHANGTTASGDLYTHSTAFWPGSGAPVEPNPSAGIPVFPRSRYRYYLRVTQVLEGYTFGSSFTLGFEMHRFDQAARTWTNEGTLTARMAWTTAPAGYPSGADYLTGSVQNAAGATVGSLTMGWVSPYLRRAVLEVDRVGAAEAPLDNGAGVGWRTIFDTVGWDVTVQVSDANVAEPSGESFSDAELHATMLARRAAASLDAEWRYHVLCVRRLDSTSRGIMYDAYGGDSNNIPREGCGISSHWMVPNTATWGLIAGMRFGSATSSYFRTAVHEIGHALGLYHNTADNGIMNTTDTIAASAVPPVQFPNNVLWSFAADDQKRLRHMPDVWVRPGGVPFGSAYSVAPISPTDMIQDAEGLELEVTPLLDAVPLGAPVRVTVALVNTSGVPLPVPGGLGLKSGFVRGKVVDPAGTVRTFSPLLRCVEEHELRMLEPGGRVESSMTLLRGAEGALFPSAGPFTVVVEVDWDLPGSGPVGIAGEGTVMVTPAENPAHADAALKVLSTPDALLTLVLGGDHLVDGVEAIRAGVDNPVLRPHFAVVEAKRIGERFGRREAQPQEAAKLLDENAVMSPSEVKSTAKIAGQVRDRKATGYAQLVKRLRIKVAQVSADDATRKLVDQL